MSHAHAEPSFLSKYVFSTDHKVIAKQYMITGLFMALFGGYAAYLIRTQLAFPGQGIPGYGTLTPDAYNAVVTMHGTIMVFWVAMPVLVAGFGNLLIPLMIGADDMAFPRLNMASYWVFLVSALVLVSSVFVPGGPAAGGWTSYPPLSAIPAYSGVNWGITLWIVAVALEFVAFLMGGINFIVTAINLRAPGMSMWDMPLFVWEEVAASVVFMLSVGPLIAGAVMLLLDHVAGTGFYDAKSGGDPILFQHLFWFFGHPEVYVLLLPSLGIIAEVITANARKTLFGYKMIVYSVFATGLLSFIVWAHHQFIAGIDPRMAAPFSVTTILISVPVGITMFSLFATLWGGSIRFPTSMKFALGMLATFLVGGVTGVLLGAASVDIYMHDTAYVVAHFHFTLFPIVFLGTFAGIYHWYPKMFGRMLDERLGTVHFWGTLLFFNMTFLPMFNVGMMGQQRRIADPTQFAYLKDAGALQLACTIGAWGLLAVQLPFVWNFFRSMARGELAGRNPWQATTLEWNTASPPPHGNFDEVPTVYRGPYVYSPDDRDDTDFVPQHDASIAAVLSDAPSIPAK